MLARSALQAQESGPGYPVSEAKGFASRRGPQGCALVSAVPLRRAVQRAVPAVGQGVHHLAVELV
jgi:hypothetical protein